LSLDAPPILPIPLNLNVVSSSLTNVTQPVVQSQSQSIQNGDSSNLNPFPLKESNDKTPPTSFKRKKRVDHSYYYEDSYAGNIIIFALFPSCILILF
jgi:hypothetical protein